MFARVSPQEKEAIVRVLRGLGRRVAYCGDGTNDVGALVAADVGSGVMADLKDRNDHAGAGRPNPYKSPRFAQMALAALWRSVLWGAGEESPYIRKLLLRCTKLEASTLRAELRASWGTRLSQSLAI